VHERGAAGANLALNCDSHVVSIESDQQMLANLLAGNLRNRRLRYRRQEPRERYDDVPATRNTIGWKPVRVGEMKYLDLHGDRVAYREAGAGEALLLIHGMAGSRRPGGRSCPSCQRNSGWWHRTCSGKDRSATSGRGWRQNPTCSKRPSGGRIADLSAVLVIQGVRCAIANTPKLRRGLLAAEEKPPSTAPSWTRRRTNTSGSESPTCMRSAGLEAG
jgi:hypothetical protein